MMSGSKDINKDKVKLSTDSSLDEDAMYRIMSRNYLLTEQQLVDNGFPRPHPRERGKAVIKISQKHLHGLDKQLLWCDRCGCEYRVDKFGIQVNKGDCVYHSQKIREFKKRGKTREKYPCCQGGPESEGCMVKKSHLTNISDHNNLHGYVATKDRSRGLESSGKVFSLDCEMCTTKVGRELIKVTVIDYNGNIVYESLVKPDNAVFTYNTKFSGIAKKDLAGVTTRLKDVQAALLNKLCSKDILVGHSLQNDLKTLKLMHNRVVDTQVVFPHKKGGNIKSSLKVLSEMYLKRSIQTGEHDSFEDALAALDLMKMKVKEDVKILQKKGENKG